MGNIYLDRHAIWFEKSSTNFKYQHDVGKPLKKYTDVFMNLLLGDFTFVIWLAMWPLHLQKFKFYLKKCWGIGVSMNLDKYIFGYI